MTRLSWGDKSLDTSCDPVKMGKEVERQFPGESGGFYRFMHDHEAKLRVLFPCLQKSYTRVADLMSPKLLRALPRSDAAKCFHLHTVFHRRTSAPDLPSSPDFGMSLGLHALFSILA